MIEIERKFLLRDERWRQGAESTRFLQGYIFSGQEKTLRVRIAGANAWLTIKGKGRGLSRLEYEYAIPLAEAEEMLKELCEKPPIEKWRHQVSYEGFLWEIDEFMGENQGLIVAEIELQAESEVFPIPEWIGEEVSGDPRYYNAYLYQNPYSTWKK